MICFSFSSVYRFCGAAFLLGPLLLSGPVFAQGQQDGFYMNPEGANGRYTREQAEILALRVVPGIVVDRDVAKFDRRTYFEYTIEVADGSVYEVEISANTGKLYEIEVERLSANPRLPFSVISPEMADALAIGEVDKRERGMKKPKARARSRLLQDRSVVYVLEIRKGVYDVDVTIDARTGDVLKYKKRH